MAQLGPNFRDIYSVTIQKYLFSAWLYRGCAEAPERTLTALRAACPTGRGLAPPEAERAATRPVLARPRARVRRRKTRSRDSSRGRRFEGAMSRPLREESGRRAPGAGPTHSDRAENVWCRWRGSNSRPSVYKTAALPLCYTGSRDACYQPPCRRSTRGARRIAAARLIGPSGGSGA